MNKNQYKYLPTNTLKYTFNMLGQKRDQIGAKWRLNPSPACRQPTSPSPPRSLPLPSQYEVGVPSARTCSKAYNRTAAACRRRPPSATRTSRTRVRCAAALPPRGCLPFKHLDDAPAPRRHRAFALSLSRLGPSSTSTRPPSSPLQSTRRSTRPCVREKPYAALFGLVPASRTGSQLS